MSTTFAIINYSATAAANDAGVTPSGSKGHQTPQSDKEVPPSSVKSDTTTQNGGTNTGARDGEVETCWGVLDSGDDFEGLVGDLRRTFIGWLKKTELEVRGVAVIDGYSCLV